MSTSSSRSKSETDPHRRAKYEDGDEQLAKSRGYDLVQLKLDGWFCRVESAGGIQQYYSDTDRVFHSTTFVGLPSFVALGEFLRGTQWSKAAPERSGHFHLFDLVEIDGFPLGETYARRYIRLRRMAESFPPTWHVVQNYRMAERGAVWARYVEQEGYEGLIYRRSDGLQDAPIIRHKKIFTLDGVVVGIEPGKGKHEGRMGALRVLLPNGTETSVGNGFDDQTRELVAVNPNLYIGRVVEFTANAVFESGNVRHGRFVRWRDDKTTLST